MSVAADGLATGLATMPDSVDAQKLTLPMPRLARRVPRIGRRHAALNVDRVIGRFAVSSAWAAQRRRRFDAFHLVDHVYSHLASVLPAERTGIYCHDLDAFRSVTDEESPQRPAWFRAMTRASLTGLGRAGAVFYSTAVVRDEVLSADLVDPARLVWAPLGIDAVFSSPPSSSSAAERILARLSGSPYLLHVGSDQPRKRLDLLVRIFGELARRHPDLWLVQRGAPSAALQAAAREAGFADRLLCVPPVDRATLAALYKRAAVVAVTSDSEGFGLPVIEALASGTEVVASDIPVLREVGGDVVRYQPVGDIEGWVHAVEDGLGSSDLESSRQRSRHAARFSWDEHARIIAATYRRLAQS